MSNLTSPSDAAVAMDAAAVVKGDIDGDFDAAISAMLQVSSAGFTFASFHPNTRPEI